MWKHALSALSLLNGWMDFKGICTDKSLENGKELIRFSDLAFMRSKMSKNALSLSYLLKGSIYYDQNRHVYHLEVEKS